MRNKVVKTVVIFILVLMGLYDLGGMPAGIDNDLSLWITLTIVSLSVGCYFFLKWLINLIERKGWLNSYFLLKSILLSLLVLWVIRAIMYVVFTFCFSVFSEDKNKASSESDFNPSYKELLNQGEIMNEYFDSTSNVYSNYLYKFSFRIPKGWSRDKGLSKHTVLGVFSESEYCIVSVNVVDLKTNESNITILDVIPDLDKHAKFIASGLENKGFNPQTSLSKRTFFANYNAVRTDVVSLFRQDNYELEYHDIIYQVIRGAYSFTVSIKVPQRLYQENPDYYVNLLTNFIFLN